jgi:hypothetical protein
MMETKLYMVAVTDEKAAELSKSMNGFLRISNFYAYTPKEAFSLFLEKSGLYLNYEDVNITLI